MLEPLLNYLENIDPVLAALYATTSTWLVTAAGASVVFLFRGINRTVMDGMLGFTAGVMVAASVWSLLIPAMDMTDGEGFLKVLPAVIGFLCGAAFLFGLD